MNKLSKTDLFASRQSKKILTGTLTSIQDFPINKENIDCALLFVEDFKVIITPKELGLQETEREDITKVIRSMIGAEIDFIVTTIDSEHKIALASRKAAMEINKRNFDKYVKGNIVNAKVVAVGKNSVIVETLGIETSIPKDEVDYIFINDLREYCQVGDSVKCKIKEIDKEKKELQLSIKDLKLDPYTNIEETLPRNSQTLATITGIQPYGVFVKIENIGVSALCPVPNWANFSPAINDQYVIRIKRINKENRRIDATLMRLARRA